MRLSLVISIVIVGTARPEATTVHVPADEPTIQAGIDAAQEADTVLVADGVYTGNGNRDIDFHGRDLVLKSKNGPEVTIIDCQGSQSSPHYGVCFTGGYSTAAVIEGFTIRNAYGRSNGGAIVCVSNSNPTISNNIIVDNYAANMGAGVYCWYSGPMIRGNIISHNSVTGTSGFRNGGGIACWHSQATITDNVISHNSARLGGGVYCSEGSNPVISHNVISHNTGEVNGGGIHCGDNSSPTITDNEISYNFSDCGGGINCVVGCSPEIRGNVIGGNTARFPGGGILCAFDCQPSIVNTTIVGNSPSGLYLLHSFSYIENTIVAFNQDGPGLWCDGQQQPRLSSCNVFGNDGGDWVGGITDQLVINGNFSADPLFCDADNSNFHLWAASPCAPIHSPNNLLVGALGVACAECGDANADGTVSAVDVAFIKGCYFGSDILPVISSADMDCDGEICINDIVLLAGYLYGYGPTPCCTNGKRERRTEYER